MEILEKILGNRARVKIMKLFLLNKGSGFRSVDIATRSRVNPYVARRELKLLASVNFVKRRDKEWFFNTFFKYASPFEELLVRSDTLNKQTILDTFKKIGKIKLLISSGVFIKYDDSRLDLLIIGDKLRRGRIEEGIRKLEALIGVELVYAVFDTEEFIYRLNMYDKLIRDVLDYPHEVVLQAKELSHPLTLKKL